MIAFKSCMKILKKNKVLLCIYIGISIFMTAIFMNSSDDGTNGFEYTTIKVGYINHDEDGTLTKGLEEFLGSRVKLVDIVDSDNGIKDALLYRQVDYVMVVPENYSKDFETGVRTGYVPEIQKMEVPATFSGSFAGGMIDNYLSTVDTLMNSINGLTMEEAVKKAEVALKDSVDVTIESKVVEDKTASRMSNYFNFCIYSILGSIVVGSGVLISRFNEEEVRKRNSVSPMTITKLNVIQALANCVFGIIVFGILIIGGFFLYRGDMFSFPTLLMCINMLVGVVSALGYGFTMTKFIHSENGIGAFSNVISLLNAFIGGVFVPVTMLSGAMQKVAYTLPAYWYVQTNKYIVKVTSFSSEGMSDVYRCMGIQLLIAFIIFAIGVVKANVTKK